MDPTSRPRRGRATSLALALATIFMLVATLVTPAVAAAADPTADQSAPVTTPASSDTPASSPDASATPAPTARYIVSFASGTADDQAAIIAAAGATQVDTIPQLQMYVVDADATAVAVLSAATGVSSVTPDDVRDAGAVPSDPSYADQWSLPKIGWDQVYGNAQLSGNAVVALLDTGVDSHNPDIANQLVAGTSIIAGSNPTEDPNGHGTAMAGIIAAETNNGSDIAGIGYSNVKIMPITVLNASGLGQDDDIIAGVVYAVGHGADVINMSFSNPGYSPALQAAINYAWAHNVVVVAATGNDGSSGVTFPAGDKGVIGVSNTDQNDALNSTSNFGADTFLAAPGTDIVTLAAGGDTTSVTGTSASSAEVAAAAALLRAADPSAKNGVIVSRLARNADAVGTVDQTGNGRLNLARAIADTSTDSVEPAGAAPVGSGGPFVGPYVAAAATTVSSVNSTTANGTYGIGASISIQITFSGSETVVTTGGTPTLALNSGGTASYASGSGSATLTFNYTVAASQNNADLDYSATTSLALNGGTITNSTTAATLALPTPGAANSLGANKALVIDTNPHTCTWTGGTSTAWATATNWSGCANVAPQTGDAVVIGPIASPTNWPTLIASTTVTSISITGRTVTTNQRGGCLTIATGQTLTVSGNLTITGSIDGGTGTTCGTGTATGIIASGTANLSVGGNVLLTDSTGGPPENPIISMGSGTLTVAGNFTKGTNSTFTAGTSTALFNGSGAQSISGSTIAFNNLTIGDGTHSPTVTLGANVTVGSALNVTAGTYTAVTYTTTVTGMTTVTGAIYTGGSGTQTLTGGLTMTGGTVTSTGTISLGGNVTTNASASSATISGGTLSLGATRTFTIAGDLVVSSIISGTAFGLTKTGSGTLTLSGVNTYTGVTTINAGTLSVGTIGNGGSAGNLGAAAVAAANLVLGGGTLQYTGATSSTNRNFTLTAATTSTIDITSGTTLTIPGATSTATTGALTKVGLGTLLLSAANTYTGLTTVSAGTLQYGITNALSSGPVTVNGGTFDIVSFNDTVGAVTLTSGTIAGTTGVLTGTSYAVQSGTVSAILAGAVALAKTTAGTVTLSGVNTYTGVTTINAGTLSVGTIGDGGAAGNLGAATNAAGNLVLGGGTLQYTGATASTNRNFTLTAATTSTVDITTAGTTLTISGASTATTGALTKVGLGTLLLSGANLYTGATTINAGTLLVNGSTASGSAVAVNSGGTLGGSGTVGTVTVNSSGTLAPGTTSGILNTGNLSLNSGGTFSVDLNGTTAGTGYDQANVTGTVSLGSATLSGFLGSGFTPTAGNTFVIINNDSSDLVTGIFNGLPQGASLTIGGTSFHISYNFNNGSGSNDVALIADSAPVITTTGGTTAYTENGAGLAIDTGLTVTDADSTNLTGATVSITGNFASGQDVLGFVNTASITGSYNASTGVLTLSGTTTLANYLTALRSVTYWNSSDNPSTATRTISFTATDDGSATSNTATKSVSVTAVNDAPVAAAVPSAPQTLPYAAAITDVTISASDIDNSGSQLTASTQFNFNGGSFNSGLPSGLSLSVPTSNGSAVPGSASWTLSGNMNVLPGTYVVRVLVNDGGVSVPVDVTFSINKANQATLTITAPSSATFGAADAAFTTSGGSGIGLITFDAGTSTACTIVGGKLHVSSGTGTCSVIATQAADANYTATSSVAFDITVNKAAPVIVVNGYSGTYDGAAHGATGTATGVLGESLAGLTLGSSFANVPGGTANWAFIDATGNYNSASGSVPITITKANPTIVVNGYSGTYDGAAHGATGTATGVLGESLAGLTLGSSFTSVPGGTANWTFAGTGNYNSASGSVAIAIAPKAASVTPDAKSKVYGTTDPTLTGTLSGFLPADAVTATYGRTVGETVGAYTISATLHAASGVLANYSVTSNTATFTITTGSLNHLVLSPVSSTVNPGVGQAYTATGFDIFGNNMGDVTGATTFSIAGGSCTGATCSSTVAGDHVVTGTDGSATGTATLHITGVQGVVSGATYHTVTPVRVLDSRINLGAGLFHSQVKQTVAIATAASGVPANAVAVTGNVTVTGQTRLGYVTVAPHLTSYVIPSTSTINFPVRDNRANGVTVPLAAGGTLDFAYWAAGTTATVNIVFDVTGYFTNDTTGATYHTVTPVRVLDSRTGLGAGIFHSQTKQTVAIVTAASGVPANAIAVTGNVTVTGQTRLGYVTVAPHLTSRVIPSTSTINFPVGENRANNITVPLAAGGTLDFAYWAAGTTATVNVVFDVTGYFTNDLTGATYHTLTPVRVLDSRTGLGAGLFHTQIKQTVAIATTASGVPTTATAVTGNVTVTGQTRLGYVTVAPSLTSHVIPSTSTINFPVGDNRANGITVPLAAGGKLDFAYWAAGTTATVNVVFDVTGYFG